MNKQLSIKELIQLGAADGQFFMHTFFPKAARQKSPPCHREIWQLLDSNNRLVNIQVFRGGAKTTLLRGYTAKRIAYGLARTILYIGKSESHAARSINWIRNQVDTNKLYSETFGLRAGQKWQDGEAEIIHGIDKHPIWIMGMGITGSIRGINRDDFRPDLIVLDDPIDDENAGTEEQREKIATRIYGAIKESLTPRSEAEDAKLVLLQTPIHRDDASMKALEDPEWKSAVFSIITSETTDAPIDQQCSAWPERYPNEEIRAEKRAAIGRNRASIWYREKECKLVSPETVAFRSKWLKFYEKIQLPDYGVRVLVIDPVPPPSPRELEAGLTGKDFEALHVVQRTKNDFYSVDLRLNRGHDPSWTIANAFELAEKHNVRKILVESVAYQRTLAWLIRQAMEQRQRWWQVHEFTDQRSKFSKIVDALNGVASSGHLYVMRDQTELITQFNDYPRVSNDDALETLALGVSELSGVAYDGEMFGEIVDGVYEEIDYASYCGAP